MKKSIFTVALILGAAATAMAQDKEEKQYTPESGDWAIGIDATPFLNYFGNFIGGTDANAAPSWNYLTTNQTITGKYFTSEDMAFRGSLRLGFGGNSESNMVADRTNTADPAWPAAEPMVENTAKYGSTNIGLSGGIEYRKGKGRLIGFYGGELGFAISSMKETYTYGNALTASTAGTPVNVDAADDFTGGMMGTTLAAGTDGMGVGYTSRMLEYSSGTGFGIGVRGFIGAEYFVLPKLSVGGEFGWGLVFMSQGASTTTAEAVGTQFNATADAVETITSTGNTSSSFGVDTDSNNSVFGPAGSLRMTLHF